MKKLLVLMLALSTTLAFASCGNTSTNDETPVGGEDGIENNVENGDITGSDVVDGTEDNLTDNGDNDVTIPDTDAENEDITTGAETETTTTVSVLSAGWNTYADEEKFPAMGGDMEAMVDGAPGNYSIADAEVLDSVLGFPAAQIESIDEAASLMHMMNANTFTGAAYHLVEGIDASVLAEEIKNNILARQWMCGFPETLVIIKADDCLITAFGNGEIIENFKTKTIEANEGAELLFEEPIE